MSFCPLIQRNGKWICPKCNGRPLKGNYKRQCSKPQTTPEWFTSRHTAAKITDPTLPTLLARLDSCLSSGCEHLTAGICTHWRGSDCNRRERHFQRLAMNPCKFAN